MHSTGYTGPNGLHVTWVKLFILKATQVKIFESAVFSLVTGLLPNITAWLHFDASGPP